MIDTDTPRMAGTLPLGLLHALATFPDRLADTLALVSPAALRFKPADWSVIPGERFSIIEQVCHLRDIETDGYQVRIRRVLAEETPQLEPVDGYRLARELDYANTRVNAALEQFRAARQCTLETLETIAPEALSRAARFGGYGRVTLDGLVHLLHGHDLLHLSSMHDLLALYRAQATHGD